MNSTAFVDLTAAPSGDRSEPSGSRRPPTYSPQDSARYFSQPSQAVRSPKRRQLDNGSSAGLSSSHVSDRNHRQFTDIRNGIIESVDLTEVNDASMLSKALSKQREDAVKAQMAEDAETGRSALTAYKCPVCMDTAVDATSTTCGHLFCHKCIIDTLRFGEERRAQDGHGKAPRGTCPVCRKALSRVDVPGARRNLVPLQLKLATKKRS